MNKYFYIHVPKTAGSSLNTFLEKNVVRSISHAEGSEKKLDDLILEYDLISGHISYTQVMNELDIRNVKTMITFREPFSYVVSHLCWVRKLADKGEEKRFSEHPKVFQDIALKMKEFDFSDPVELSSFIDYLEEIDFTYFHNTQTLYASNDKSVENAKLNIDRINFVGITEGLEDYFKIISLAFKWDLGFEPRNKVNVNSNKYGLDLNNRGTKDVLYRLVDKDILVYEYATQRFKSTQFAYLSIEANLLSGYIDEVGSNFVRGWVMSHVADSAPLRLSVCKDGNQIASGIADIKRANLKEKGIHPTGECEFYIEFDENLVFTENLEVFVENSNYPIPFSVG